MEILNRISQLALMGYTVSFKQHPFGTVCMEMTYDHYYHAYYLLYLPIDMDSDLFMGILDDLKRKIDQLIEKERKNEVD